MIVCETVCALACVCDIICSCGHPTTFARYPPPHHVVPPGQIAGLWKSAGGSQSTCPVAVAVALAESGGDCSAININTDKEKSKDRGLWQINDYWHPEVSNACAYACACNAKSALSISSSGSDFSPWST